MLSGIMNDPEKLNSILSMASSFLGQGAGPGTEDAAPGIEAQEPWQGPGMPDKHAGGPTPGQIPAMDFDPTAELMSKAMPVIAAIAQSGKNAVDRDRMNLLISLKPFVAHDVGAQMDHAVRLLSIARMAKAAMGQLGQMPGNGGQHV